jgi:hypothetical protein
MVALAPFAPGDVFVTATRLDPGARYPTGAGMIRQIGADGHAKAEVATGGQGLISALHLHPDGRLFALDPQARRIDIFAPSGERRPGLPQLPPRAYGAMLVLANGELLLAEHVVGGPGPFAGDGKLYRCADDGRVLQVYDTITNGGVSGFLGVTHMALAADGHTVFHLSETGSHIYAHDLANNRPLGIVYTRQDPPGMLFGLVVLDDGSLLVATGGGVRQIGPDGAVLRDHPLPSGRGWAVLVPRPGTSTFWLLDFFGGTLARFDPASGLIGDARDLGLPKALAGIAEVPA